MTDDLTPAHRFAERVAAFTFGGAGRPAEPYEAELRTLAAGLPALPAEPAGADVEALLALLEQRSRHVREEVAPYRDGCMEALAVRALHAPHAFEVLFAHTGLLDALHTFSFAMALAELPVLLQVRRLEAGRELSQRQAALPLRREKLALLEGELARGEGDAEDPAHRTYLEGVATTQREELRALERTVGELEAAVPALHAFSADPAAATARIVMFARGGYGRAEMSFSSDVDTGYCLDGRGLQPAQIAVYHELVLRVERLLHECGLETAHQFFELDEDLSRFAEPEALHTIPSILESRPLAGNGAVLAELQVQFRAVAPFERLVRRKIEEFDGQGTPDYTAMNLKEDFGGLRTIQVPLWLLGMTYDAASFMTVELLLLAREKQLLSLWEVSRLLLALEFLYDLRNFTGGAERYYYDREARESGFYIHSFRANHVDDHVARLYLFRKQRFASIDAFDTYRLRLVEEVQRIAQLLLARVLDRTVSHRLGTFQVQVHLGAKRIIAVQSPQEGDAAELRSLFRDGEALLLLFGYIAETNYDLSPELKDALAGVVTSLTPPDAPEARARQAALLSALMCAPFAHRALETLFEINDPLAPELPSLMGRFIPAFDEAIFLLRRFDGQTLPLHAQMLRSLASGEAELAALRRDRPELHAMLRRDDVLALKWSLVLQGLGRLEGNVLRPAQTAEQAAGVLTALGYDDAELERRVRLLIEHHATVTALARTATYMDQALAQYFEIAGRDLVNVTLLYLVNLAVLRAQGESAEVDVASVRSLYNEANAMLGEMRGFPVQERSLELINVYFDRKKEELLADTRLHLLLQGAIARGLRQAVFEPLRRSGDAAWGRVEQSAEELEALQREIVLGGLGPAEQARLEERLLQGLRHRLGRDAVLALTAEHDALLSWFFSAFANRYLMSSLPGDLAAQLAKFAHFRSAQVIVDVVSGPHGASEGLLIYLRGLSRPHTRVAYAMSRSRVNIGSGKVNCVDLAPDERAYCYFFQVAMLDPEERLAPRDLELMIAGESPPELSFPERTSQYERLGVRVEYRGDDGKGYRVVPHNGAYAREEAALPHLRVVLRDEPYLFYKVSRAFDLFDVEIQQSLITTIGNQVVDYFYLMPADYERLRASRFDEVLINLVHSDLLAVVR